MRNVVGAMRKAVVGMALAGLILFPGFRAGVFAAPAPPTGSRTLHFAFPEKRVDITVTVHGKIDGYSQDSIEHLVEEWLEVAHLAVVNADGVDVLELHVSVEVDDDDDDDDGVKDADDEDGDGDGDGKGWRIHTDCGDFDEDKEVETLDAIDDVLHAMINDFIDKYVH